MNSRIIDEVAVLISDMPDKQSTPEPAETWLIKWLYPVVGLGVGGGICGGLLWRLTSGVNDLGW
jgi:hypothetical protein